MDQDMAVVRVAKKELRKALKLKLAKLDPAAVTAQSANIAKTLMSSHEYQNASRISVYLSMPSSEVQTTTIVRDALKTRKQVFVPFFYPAPSLEGEKKRMVMDMLELASESDFDDLKPDAWGIPTLSEESISQRANCFGGLGRSIDATSPPSDKGLDVIITPGLAFDRKLGRLGRGMGFYDRFFEQCVNHSAKDGTKIWRVGLSLSEQLLPDGESVPMDDNDVRLDALITGDGELFRR